MVVNSLLAWKNCSITHGTSGDIYNVKKELSNTLLICNLILYKIVAETQKHPHGCFCVSRAWHICYYNNVEGMANWFNNYLTQNCIAILIASIFVVFTFACFTIATNHGHSLDIGATCEMVMNLADNAVAQTGLMLLLSVAVTCLYFRPFNTFILSDTLKIAHVFHSPSPDYLVSNQEYSYLRELFSSGLIHTKLYNIG